MIALRQDGNNQRVIYDMRNHIRMWKRDGKLFAHNEVAGQIFKEVPEDDIMFLPDDWIYNAIQWLHGEEMTEIEIKSVITKLKEFGKEKSNETG